MIRFPEERFVGTRQGHGGVFPSGPGRRVCASECGGGSSSPDPADSAGGSTVRAIELDRVPVGIPHGTAHDHPTLSLRLAFDAAAERLGESDHPFHVRDGETRLMNRELVELHAIPDRPTPSGR